MNLTQLSQSMVEREPDGLSIGEVIKQHHQLLNDLSREADTLGISATPWKHVEAALWYLTYRCRRISDRSISESEEVYLKNAAKMLEVYPELTPYTSREPSIVPFDVNRLLTEAVSHVEDGLRQLPITPEDPGSRITWFLAVAAGCRNLQKEVRDNWFVRR